MFDLQTLRAFVAVAREGNVSRAAHSLNLTQTAVSLQIKSLAERSANLAVELAGKIIGAKLKADDHTRLIQESMAKFPATDGSRN